MPGALPPTFKTRDPAKDKSLEPVLAMIVSARPIRRSDNRIAVRARHIADHGNFTFTCLWLGCKQFQCGLARTSTDHRTFCTTDGALP